MFTWCLKINVGTGPLLFYRQGFEGFQRNAKYRTVPVNADSAKLFDSDPAHSFLSVYSKK
jgi:hypothetical protein